MACTCPEQPGRHGGGLREGSAWPCPPRERVRSTARGYDPTLCGFARAPNPGADQLASNLRVPGAPTRTSTLEPPAPQVDRYLFQVATIGIGRRARLVGLGVEEVIGLDTSAQAGPPAYPLRQNVVSRGWRFSDVLPTVWGVRLFTPWELPSTAQKTLTTDTFVWRWAPGGQGLVYETATFPAAHLDWKGTPDDYTTLTGYTQPFGGIFPGQPVGGSLGRFTSDDFPVLWAGKSVIDPIDVEGPGYLVLYCMVSQSNPSRRQTITIPQSFPMSPDLPEESFVADWPQAIMWSVGGWLEVER